MVVSGIVGRTWGMSVHKSSIRWGDDVGIERGRNDCVGFENERVREVEVDVLFVSDLYSSC